MRKIYRKKDIELIKEENGNAYVEPSSETSSSLSSDLSKTKAKNPTDNDFIVNANSYNSNPNDNTVTLSINGKNPSDATKNFNKVTQNPNVKRLMNTTNVNAKIHMKNEEINRLRESSVKFTKKEIKNMFK